MKKLDNYGTEMIPIRLIISISIITAITAMIVVSYQNISIIMSENKIQNEIDEIESKLYTMIKSGVARDIDIYNSENGTMRTKKIDLPSNIIYLSFGVDPDPDNNGELTTGLTTNGSAIFYKVEGGNKNVIWLDSEEIRFREGNFSNNRWIINKKGQGLILTSGGINSITFELIEKNYEKYILIHSNDNLEKM